MEEHVSAVRRMWDNKPDIAEWHSPYLNGNATSGWYASCSCGWVSGHVYFRVEHACVDHDRHLEC